MTQSGGFLLYSATEERTTPSRFASREAEGTGPVTPRQPARESKVPSPEWMPSAGRKEKD